MRHLFVFILLSLLLGLAVPQAVGLSQVYKPETLASLGPEYSDPAFIKLLSNYFGCGRWSEGSCVECSKGYIFNNGGVCCEVDEYCQQFNTAVGICEVCYTGYSVSSNGSCTLAPATPSAQGCASWKNAACQQCSVRYYFNQDHVCVPVSDHCREWTAAGECTACYYGYEVSNASCVLGVPPLAPSVQANPYCNSWNTTVCLSCATRTYFNTAGVCTPVSDNCRTWDRLSGQCLSCYAGNDLVNGSCVYSPSNTAAPLDPGCSSWEKATGACVSCSARWVLNPKGVCTPVSGQCKTYDQSGCLSCYAGYDLVGGDCTYSASNDGRPADGGCRIWDWQNSLCLECSKNWVFNANAVCVAVSDQCRLHHSKTGLCTACYKGYALQDGACVFSKDSPSVSDLGCKIWDWTKNACSSCSSGFYFSQTGACQPASPLCKTFDSSNGACTSCFGGYDLVSGLCVLSPTNTAAPADPGCKSWEGGVCKECSSYYAFNASGVCTAVSDQCKSYSGLECTSCYNGYVLVSGSCFFSPLNSAHPSDAGCATWNWKEQLCLKCSPYWYFAGGVCRPVSDLCRTYDEATGSCLSCFLGYDLANGTCRISESSKPTDAGCLKWDWTAQVCQRCSPYWVLINGTCQSVSPYCKTYEEGSGLCTSCFIGYALGSGVCAVANSLCKAQGDGGACLSCYGGYALYKGQCVNTASLANIALYYAACCPEKLAQLQAEGRIPQ